MRIAIDVDGVITDTEPDQLVCEAHRPGFFAGLRPIDGAIDGIAALARDHEIVLCSSAMYVPHAFGEKFAWLQEHVPFVGPDRLVFCGEKDVVAGDVLVDDSVYHLKRFAGRGILFTRPYNAHDPYPDRARDWNDLLVMLQTGG
jgi:5'-nucleotidase